MVQPAPAAPTLFNYTTGTNVTYFLNNTPDTMQSAEENCRGLGGHLASFSSREQQYEVEKAFLDAGQLLRSYQPVYWLGLAASATGNFRSGPLSPFIPHWCSLYLACLPRVGTQLLR